MQHVLHGGTAHHCHSCTVQTAHARRTMMCPRCVRSCRHENVCHVNLHDQLKGTCYMLATMSDASSFATQLHAAPLHTAPLTVRACLTST